MRLDKYLKVSRLIKRRTVANEACDNERVSVNGRVQRASYEVKPGDRIAIRFGARATPPPCTGKSAGQLRDKAETAPGQTGTTGIIFPALSYTWDIRLKYSIVDMRGRFFMAYETGQQLYHRVELEGRDKLTVSGVEDVERFDEGCIVMATCEGTLIVTGEGLHIGKLSLDGGELQVDGRVEALTYEEQQAPRGSWLTRLLG